jgi:hypothetical protein
MRVRLALNVAVWALPAFFSPGAAWQPPAAAQGRAPLARPRRRDAFFSGLLVGAYVARRPLHGGATRMAVIDSAAHVWKNDPAYPWAKEETNSQKFSVRGLYIVNTLGH